MWEVSESETSLISSIFSPFVTTSTLIFPENPSPVPEVVTVPVAKIRALISKNNTDVNNFFI